MMLLCCAYEYHETAQESVVPCT